MGRHKLDDEVKAKRGTLRKCRVNEDQPKPEKVKDIVEIPKFLNRYGAAFYRKYHKLLSDLNVLTESDLETLAVIAGEYGKYVQAQYNIKKEGYTTTGVNKNGSAYEMISPWINIANNAFKNYNSMLAKFGLSPSDRSKISVIKDDEPSGDSVNIEDFLN